MFIPYDKPYDHHERRQQSCTKPPEGWHYCQISDSGTSMDPVKLLLVLIISLFLSSILNELMNSIMNLN